MNKITVEGFFLSALGSKEKLEWYLKNNVHLLKYIEVQWPKSLFFADMTANLIPKEKRKEIIRDIDSNRILDLLRKDRPDLYSVILKYPNGKNWIERNIEIFKARFS